MICIVPNSTYSLKPLVGKVFFSQIHNRAVYHYIALRRKKESTKHTKNTKHAVTQKESAIFFFKFNQS